jgi:hypothetical protein
MAFENFPLGALIDYPFKKRQANREDFSQAADFGGGIGGSIGDMIAKYKQDQLIKQIQQLMQTQGAPQQGPPMAPAGTPQPSMSQIPPGQPMSAGGANIGQDVKMPQPIPTQQPGVQPASGMGAPAQDNTQQMNALLMKLDPQGMIANLVAQQDPLKQAQAAYYKSRASALGSGSGTPGKSTWYESPDGTISKTPTEGSFPVQLSDAQGAQYTAVPKSAKEKNAAVSSRGEAMQRGIDVRQIDKLAQTVGLTSAQRNLLQQNNMRASRAVELASRPMTWQEFNNVLTDAAAIMQGGVPHIDQIHNMTYPTWQEQFAKWRTYATSNPTMNVPEDIRNRVVAMVKGIQKVDNRYLLKNAEFQKDMLGPTIRGGISQFQKPIQSMTETITSGSGGEQGKEDPLGIR